MTRNQGLIAALAIVASVVVLSGFTIAAVEAGRDSRRQSVECIQAGGQWSKLVDRCQTGGK